MGVDVEDAEDGEEGEIELEAKVLRLMQDFAQWIYDGLQEEYDYRLSDEAIEEAIRANEYQFQAATGKVV